MLWCLEVSFAVCNFSDKTASIFWRYYIIICHYQQHSRPVFFSDRPTLYSDFIRHFHMTDLNFRHYKCMGVQKDDQLTTFSTLNLLIPISHSFILRPWMRDLDKMNELGSAVEKVLCIVCHLNKSHISWPRTLWFCVAIPLHPKFRRTVCRSAANQDIIIYRVTKWQRNDTELCFLSLIFSLTFSTSLLLILKHNGTFFNIALAGDDSLHYLIRCSLIRVIALF